VEFAAEDLGPEVVSDFDPIVATVDACAIASQVAIVVFELQAACSDWNSDVCGSRPVVDVEGRVVLNSSGWRTPPAPARRRPSSETSPTANSTGA
jgi:hypothetical protein